MIKCSTCIYKNTSPIMPPCVTCESLNYYSKDGFTDNYKPIAEYCAEMLGKHAERIRMLEYRIALLEEKIKPSSQPIKDWVEESANDI